MARGVWVLGSVTSVGILAALAAPVNAAPPSNDTCAGRIGITAGEHAFDTTEATSDFACLSPDIPFGTVDVWYEYTAGVTGTAIINAAAETCGSFNWVQISVHSDCETNIACNASVCNYGPVMLSVVAQQKYIVRIATYAEVGFVGAGAFTITEETQVPANDLCEDAVNLSTAILPHIAHNAHNAGADRNTVAYGCFNEIHQGVWYTYTPPADGQITFRFSGYYDPSAYTPYPGVLNYYLRLLAGSDCGGVNHSHLVSYGCAQNGNATFIEPTFPVIGGTTYKINAGLYWEGYVGDPAATYELTHFSFVPHTTPTPANDACSTTENITSLPITRTVKYAKATDDNVQLSCDGHSGIARRGVWYTYTSPTTQYLRFTQVVPAREADGVVLGVFTGSCGSLTQVACIYQYQYFIASAGTTYRFLVAQAYDEAKELANYEPLNNSQYTFTLESMGAVPLPPANDLCGNAQTVTSLPYSDTVILGAGTNDSDTFCNDPNATQSGQGVWYTYHNPSALTYVGVFSDRQLTVYEGSFCGGLLELYCGGPSGGGGVIFPAETNTTYYLMTHDNTPRPAHPATPDTIEVRSALPLINDHCGNAVEIESFPYAVAFDTRIATEDVAKFCGSVAGTLYKSVYFTFTPEQSGEVSITIRDNYYAGLVISLTTGPCNDFHSVACHSGSYNAVNTLEAHVEAGTKYTIAIGGGLGGINNFEVTLDSSCPADFNGDSARDVADLFAYINAWLAKAASADFNDSGNVDVADLFAYINAWLAGC